MKRQVNHEAGEVGEVQEVIGVREVWTDTIFPFLYKEKVDFWAVLCLVSHKWMKMVSEIKTIQLGKKPKKEVLARFGGTIEVLDFRGGIIDKNKEFNLLYKLEKWDNLYTFSGPLHVTKLTLPYNIGLSNPTNMTNLIHLTINIGKFIPTNMTNLTNLKHFCIHFLDGSRDIPIYGMNMWLPINCHKLEYLRSNNIAVFRAMEYSGLGRLWLDTGCYFEGIWEKGFSKGDNYHAMFNNS
jgi:hypothetical protein